MNKCFLARLADMCCRLRREAVRGMELRTRMNTSPKRRVLEGDIDSEEEVRLTPCPESVFWEGMSAVARVCFSKDIYQDVFT